MSEKFFKICGFGRRANHESAIVVKAAVGGQNPPKADGWKFWKSPKDCTAITAAGFASS
jgi:hypothetical protein